MLKRLLFILATLVVLGLAATSCRHYDELVMSRVPLGKDLSIRRYRVRSPLRIISETLQFMPHGNSSQWGADDGHELYLCRDGKRWLQVSQLFGRPAGLRDDGEFVAFVPAEPVPQLQPIEEDGMIRKATASFGHKESPEVKIVRLEDREFISVPINSAVFDHQYKSACVVEWTSDNTVGFVRRGPNDPDVQLEVIVDLDFLEAR